MRRALLVIGLAAGCTSGVRPDTGLEANLRVSNATFFSGVLPTASGGPMVTELDINNPNIRAGGIGKKISGRLGAGGEAVAIALAGDAGYWTLPASNPSISNPGELEFAATMAYASTTPAGMGTLEVAAVDDQGRFGPASTTMLTITQPLLATSTLDVRLTWDSEADLDLHVELPDGTVVWARNINSYTPPPPPKQPDPAGIAAGGVLDLDSNAQCVIDGLREENVTWTQAPPAGAYQVRVDTFALCGQPAAHWTVELIVNGDASHPLAVAHGVSGESDTRLPHDETAMQKAGVLAMRFTY